MKELLRNNGYASVGTSSTLLLGPNPRRKAVIISAPAGGGGGGTTLVADGAYGAATSLNTTGAVLTYTAPAGGAIFFSATMVAAVAVSGAIELKITRGGTTVALNYTTGQFQTWVGEIVLLAGDTVQWVTLAGTATTADLSINCATQSGGGGGSSARVTLGLQGPAVLDQGITLNPGTLPIMLLDEWVGAAIREPITAISSSGSVTIGWTEIFY